MNQLGRETPLDEDEFEVDLRVGLVEVANVRSESHRDLALVFTDGHDLDSVGVLVPANVEHRLVEGREIVAAREEDHLLRVDGSDVGHDFRRDSRGSPGNRVADRVDEEHPGLEKTDPAQHDQNNRHGRREVVEKHPKVVGVHHDVADHRDDDRGDGYE